MKNPKIPKTVRCWRISVNYGQGWEEECIEFSREAALEQRKCYAENCTYPFQVKRGRMKVEGLDLGVKPFADVKRGEIVLRPGLPPRECGAVPEPHPTWSGMSVMLVKGRGSPVINRTTGQVLVFRS